MIAKFWMDSTDVQYYLIVRIYLYFNSSTDFISTFWPFKNQNVLEHGLDLAQKEDGFVIPAVDDDSHTHLWLHIH